MVSLLQLDHWDIYTFCWFSQRLLLRNYLFGPYQMTHIARNCYQSWNDFAYKCTYSVCLSLDLGVVVGVWENFVRVLCCVCVLSGCSNAVWPKKWTKDLNGSRRYCLWWPFWIIFLIWFYWIIWIAQFAQFVRIIFKNNTSVLGIQSDDVSRAQSISLSHWEAGSVLEIAEFGMFVCLFYGTKE